MSQSKLKSAAVQHHEDARCRTEVLPIASEVDNRTGDRSHEQRVRELLIRQAEMASLFGDRSDYVVVVAREKFRLPGLKPIAHLASMTGGTGAIAAAVVDPEPVVAIATLILMAAHLSGHAGGDVGQGLFLGGHHQLPEPGDITVLEPTDRVRQFDTVVFHSRSLRQKRPAKQSPSNWRRSRRKGSLRWV